MDEKAFNRRDFLKQFALLSTAPILPISFSGCGDSDTNTMSVYGAPPKEGTLPEVQGMYIHNSQVGNGILYDATNVPIDSSFEIEFTRQMDPESIAGIYLLAIDDNSEIAITSTWLTPLIALVTPISHLNEGNAYRLSVNQAAKDIDGFLLYPTQEGNAYFETL